MRLMIGDTVRLCIDGIVRTARLVYTNAQGTLAFIDLQEANVDARTRNKEISYLFKTAGSLQKAKARLVGISPIGDLRDPGFRG